MLKLSAYHHPSRGAEPLSLVHPPRVSIVIGDLSANGAGRWGGAVRPFLLAQALKQLGCPVQLIGFSQGEAAPLPSLPDMAIVSIPMQPYSPFWKSAQTLLHHLHGDVIYAYKPKLTSFGVALLHKLKTRRPLMLDIDDWEMSWHGGDDWRYRPTPKQFARDLLKSNGALHHPEHPLYLQMMEKLTGWADVITVHTQFIQQRFGGIYIPNGKDTKLFDPDRYAPQMAKAKYGLAAYRVLMFPGAPRPYKGVEDVLMAIEQLDQPDLRLVIVGGSPYDDYDQQLLERWGKWIIKLPKIPSAQMPEVIAAADLIVVPQRDTPAALAQFPLKLTDGMAMAKPILATQVGDLPRILGDTGYLVAPASPAQLAAQIAWIFDHPVEAKLQGEKARIRCIDHFSIEAMAAGLADVLVQLRSRKAS